ncbi:hypothetical protein LQ327_06115 [Actinomycetospora endophytica]|uniref:Polyketide cyclase/dehydrase/lipid transport protein n=1 Tax=Actinomycetospora endophytica TaxID=2291215 RepID=A0ABS8P3Y6_9PSEU|nr:hypothetical protein [Actinomycetospora endophytica]MCD2192962.1 hypothetical protein [Actinomycetospora endophytica]
MDAPEHWGTSSVERARATPADGLVPAPVARWTRGTTATTTRDHLWRWLCQLTVAPYSYDHLDNLDRSRGGLPRARSSPGTLTPGAEELRDGQPLLVLFVIDSFVVGEHLTVRLARPGPGPVAEFAITYAVRPDGERTRLVATVVVDGTRGVVGTLARQALAWGDLVMMRRQLTRLAALASY